MTLFVQMLFTLIIFFLTSCKSSFLFRKKENRTAQNTNKISYIPRQAYLRGDYDVSHKTLQKSKSDVKELKPVVATTTEFVEEEEFDNMRTEIAWSNPDFSSKTPVPEEDLEVLSEGIDAEISSENNGEEDQIDGSQSGLQVSGDDDDFGE